LFIVPDEVPPNKRLVLTVHLGRARPGAPQQTGKAFAEMGCAAASKQRQDRGS
jgi:hypothetical protein